MNAPKRTVALLSTSALAAGVAQGAITYTPVNATLSQNGGLTLDLNQDSTPDFQLAFDSSGSAKPYNCPYLTSTNAPFGAITPFVLAQSANQGLPLTGSGTMINASYQSPQSFGYFNQNPGGAGVGGWTASGNVEGYVGLELQDGAGTHYGWAHLIYNSSAKPANNVDTGTLTLVDAALETAPGVGIQAGQTAESGKPAVVAPPAAQTGYLGGDAQLTVIATGNPAPGYLWRAGAPGSGMYTNVPLSSRVTAATVNSDGAMNVLTLHNLNLADSLDYVVVVSNSFGAVTSSVPARLTVLPASDSPATLVHRYSFQDPAGSGSFADSVGGPDWAGTLQGSAYLTGSGLALDGGGYAALPSGIISGWTQMTVEFWADIDAGNPEWTRVFSFGDQAADGRKNTGLDYCPEAPVNYQNLDLTDTSGANVYANNNTGLLGATRQHVTVVVDPVNNSMYYYNGASVVSTLHGRVPSLANINDLDDWIGASLASADAYLAGTIYEFRIYQGVLPAKAVALNDAVGPASYIELSANPTIKASLSGGNIVLSWPASDFNFAVQSRSGLAGGSSWTTLSNQPVLAGAAWQVSLPATGTPTFFRLVSQ